MEEYYNSLERPFYQQQDPNKAYNHVPAVDKRADPNFDLTVREIGTTGVLAGNTANPIQLVQAELKKGTGHLEISANQPGKGANPSQRGWEEVDTEERRALRDIQRAVGNFDITTHSTPEASGGAGFDGRSGRYSEQNRRFTMDEVKKAIDFAAEGTFGGSVVMHTGEFQRPMFNMQGHESKFESFEGEQNEAQYLIVNPKTKQLGLGVTEDGVVYVPRKVKREGKTQYLQVVKENEETGEVSYTEFQDPLFKAIYNPDNDPNKEWKTWVPEYEVKDGDIVTDKVDFSQYVQNYLDDLKDPTRKQDKQNLQKYLNNFGSGDTKRMTAENVLVREYAAKEFNKEQQQASISQSLGQTRQYVDIYRESLEQRKELQKALKSYKELKQKYGDDWKKFEFNIPKDRFGLIPQEVSDPVKYLSEELDKNTRQIAYGREQTLAGVKQAQEALQDAEKTKTVREYALPRSHQTYAELGLYAQQQTKYMAEQIAKEENTTVNKLDKSRIKPINITMENIFPEQYGYGSEIEELVELVKNSRKRMVDLLTNKNPTDPNDPDKKLTNNPYFDPNMNKKQAEKAAKDHIKITFDTGHFNMWRKYFKREQGESNEQWHKRFEKWYLGQVDKLAKAHKEDEVVGNIHMADNFGYDDNHLAPGEGNTPIKESVEKLRKAGYKGPIAQEGGWVHGKDTRESWKLFNSAIFAKERSEQWTSPSEFSDDTPMYRSPLPNTSWTEIEDGYLGRGHRPYFVFGQYGTGNDDDRRPWSGQGME